jgi:SDR family mycofactocin-dependent oxidoreductase
MSGLLAGRVAFITGAARGQGRAHAVRMANEGANIIAVDLAGLLPPDVPYDSATPEDLAETVRLVEGAGGRIIAKAADTRDLEALRAVVNEGVSEFGRLDVIVANAGICIPSRWDQISTRAFRDVVDINLIGTWNTVMAGAQHIVDGERGGSIILISSYAGVKMQPFMVHYTASKHGVTGLARAFAAELGPHNIRVNSVHPGPVPTPMGSGDMINSLVAASASNPGLHAMGTPFLPEYACEPEDVANAVCWLASDEARYVTAIQLSVDQGMAHF